MGKSSDILISWCFLIVNFWWHCKSLFPIPGSWRYVTLYFEKCRENNETKISCTALGNIIGSHRFLSDCCATTITSRSNDGDIYTSDNSCAKLLGYSAIGEWVEANNYAFAGSVRLVFLELPKQPGDSDFVMEIQFPVCKRTVALDLLSSNQ